jgi:hypothetical protein
MKYVNPKNIGTDYSLKEKYHNNIKNMKKNNGSLSSSYV